MTYRIYIQGMHCASCAATIQNALEKLPDVHSAQLHLLHELAIVQGSQTMKHKDLEEAISGAGYSVSRIAGENETQTEEENTTQEASKKRKLFVKLSISWLGFITLMTLMLASGSIGIHNSLVKDLLIVSIALSISIYIGKDIFLYAIQSLRQGRMNMDTLTSLGSSMALLTGILSLLSYLYPAIAIKNFSGLAEMILTLAITGQAIESMLKKRSIGAQRALLDTIPQISTRLKANGAIGDGEDTKEDNREDIETSLLQQGDRVLVLPGSHVPCDGVIERGHSTFDESMITGESLPLDKTEGDTVIGGSINGQNQLVIIVTQQGKDSVIQRILRSIELAQSTKPKIQVLVDKISSIFVPIVMGLACLSFLAWLLFPEQLLQSIFFLLQKTWSVGGSIFANMLRLPFALNEELLQHIEQGSIPELLGLVDSSRLSLALYASITVLVIACPCALGLATPSAISVGIAMGSKMGVFFRSAEAMERLNKISIIALDKTGTLTEGKVSLTRVYGIKQNDEEVLRIAASLEQSSTHPLAKALIAYTKGLGIDKLVTPYSSQTLAGNGIQGTLEKDGKTYSVGSIAFVRTQVSQESLAVLEAPVQSAELAQSENSANPTELAQSEESRKVPKSQLASLIQEDQKRGRSISLLADEHEILGFFSFSDNIRESSPAAIRHLQRTQQRVCILSGDNRYAARHVASQLGIEEVYAELSPDDKYNKLLELQKEGSVAMLGDGINDAPALLQADIGVAMGGGADTAKESGDLVLLQEDITTFIRARRLAKSTHSVISQNLFWAFLYNILMLPAAMFSLISPVFAELAMALSSITVLLNANRLWLFSKKH